MNLHIFLDLEFTLKEQYDILEEQKQQIEATMERLKYKVSRYEEAVKTGVLTWEEKECK